MYNEVRVFVENKPGKLSQVSDILGGAGVDIINLELADDGQFGVFKILTENLLGGRWCNIGCRTVTVGWNVLRALRTL